MKLLDSKRENADEKIRLKTLSLGVVITDVVFHAAKAGKDIHLFSPYDVEREYGKAMSDISITDNYQDMVDNPRIRKTHLNARKLLQSIAEVQFESGYPYLMFEDTVNRGNAIDGRVNMSNLCSEILQVNTPSEYNEDLSYSEMGRDISCNLASMNIAKSLENGDLSGTVNTAIRGLTSVSDLSNIQSVPSIADGNAKSHAVGLGQMNLHGFFIKHGIQYGSEDSLDFTNIYFMTVAYHAFRASMLIAKERGESFFEFEKSKYADPSYLTDKYADPSMVLPNDNTRNLLDGYGVVIPTSEDWANLANEISTHGMYNAYLMATPPTGSISYINYSTASIHPVVDRVETRKEGKIGRVYYPQPYVTNENFKDIKDAYELGYRAVIDVYAESTKHVDQGQSLTLFYKEGATTRDLNKAFIYAWTKGIKTLYYARIRASSLAEGVDSVECVSCTL